MFKQNNWLTAHALLAFLRIFLYFLWNAKLTKNLLFKFTALRYCSNFFRQKNFKSWMVVFLKEGAKNAKWPTNLLLSATAVTFFSKNYCNFYYFRLLVANLVSPAFL
jgi:hypothetical protein